MIDVPVNVTANTTRTRACGFNKPTIANCRLKTLTLLLVAGFANAAFVFEAGTLNAQEWAHRNAVGAENAWPIAHASGPTHLVIQAPTPQKHDRSAHHGVPQIATPKHHESVDLTHAIPSHTHKTPRSIAIPDAQRTTGWKQPYAYGHFGAQHNRQWSNHHGHQRSHTQWTFR